MQKNNLFIQVVRDRQLCGILVDFAIQLMTLLEQINRDSFQRFQLRAGLNQVKLKLHILLKDFAV